MERNVQNRTEWKKEKNGTKNRKEEKRIEQNRKKQHSILNSQFFFIDGSFLLLTKRCPQQHIIEYNKIKQKTKVIKTIQYKKIRKLKIMKVKRT